ncbi:hypothetical protein Tco_0510830 [Tanacetum coccineum]
MIGTEELFKCKLSIEEAAFMVREASSEEIMKAIFQIDDNKAPGPDGFTTHFYKKSWDIIREDVCNAVKDFLQIQDDIMISQELLKGYDKKDGPKRVALKIDLQKAYDTVNWNFLEDTLNGFGFHDDVDYAVCDY